MTPGDALDLADGFEGLLGGLFSEDMEHFNLQVVDRTGPTACAATEEPWLAPGRDAVQVWIELVADTVVSTCPDGVFPFVGPCTGGALAEGEACASFRVHDGAGRVVAHLAPVAGAVSIVDGVGFGNCQIDVEMELPDGVVVTAAWTSDTPSVFDLEPVCTLL